MAEGINCFLHAGRSDLDKKFKDHIGAGIPEKEAARKVILEEHERLHNELNDLRKKVNPKSKLETYIPQSNEEQIKKINEEYDKKIASLSIETETAKPNLEKTTETGEGAKPPEGVTETAAEPTEEPRTVGVSHESLRKVASRMGLKQPERGTFLTPEEQTKRGRQLLQGGADPENVAADFKEDGKVSADEISVARAHFENLTKEAQSALDKYGKNSPEYAKAKLEMEKWSADVLKPMGTSSGASFSALQGETDIDTGSFVSLSNAFKEQHGKEPSPAQEKIIKELSGKVKGLSLEVDTLKQKLTEVIEKGTEDGKKKGKYSEAAKKAANVFRKLKTTPFKFRDENGKEYDIKSSGITWNDAVEFGAKAIEKTGEIADGVAEVIDRIKDLEWYVELSDSDKERFAKELSEHYEGSIAETPEAKNIRRLEKELDDLRSGNVKNKTEKREPSEREKELQNEIFEEKKKLGLIPSKELSEQDKQDIHEKEVAELATKFATKKDNKFTPEEAKSIWDYAKTEYLDKGEDFDSMISKTATDLGLKPEQVRDAITTPKGAKQISDAMYKKQNDRNMAIQRAKDWAKGANTNPLVKFLRAIPRFFFAAKVFGHGTVGMVTHSGINIYDPVEWKRYWPVFFKQFQFAYGNKAEYEKSMQDLQNDPTFIFWKRNGLAVDPKERYDDYQFITKIFDKMGKVGRWLTAGDRGFNALKVYRLERAKALWRDLSSSEKSDPNTPKSIAKLVNHSTGTTNLKVSETAQTAFFAPNLELARWNKLIVDPAKAVKTFIDWNKATPADKAAAKIVARRAGRILATYMGALAVNQGLLFLTGGDQKINFTDPTKSDWLKFKAGGRTLDLTGGMVSLLTFLTRMGFAATASPKDLKSQSRMDEMMKTSWSYVGGKLSPFSSTVKDLSTHHDFSGNTLPFYNDKPLHAWNHKLSLSEYLKKQQTPIPVAEFFTDLDKQLEDEGVKRPQINNILQSIFVASIVGGAGAHIGEEPEQRPSPFTNDDKKDPIFKYFLDKGMELPNTSLNSEKITDEKSKTKKTISDYPQEKQEQYQQAHKSFLKQELTTIKRRGFVYVKEYKDSKGESENEISIDPKPNAKRKTIDSLTTDELAQVLRISQSQATKKAKEKVFYKK